MRFGCRSNRSLPRRREGRTRGSAPVRISLGFCAVVALVLIIPAAARPAAESAGPDYSMLIHSINGTRAEMRALRVELAVAVSGQKPGRLGSPGSSSARGTGEKADLRALAAEVGAMRMEWSGLRAEAARVGKLLRLHQELKRRQNQLGKAVMQRKKLLELVGMDPKKGELETDPAAIERALKRFSPGDTKEAPDESVEAILRRVTKRREELQKRLREAEKEKARKQQELKEAKPARQDPPGSR